MITRSSQAAPIFLLRLLTLRGSFSGALSALATLVMVGCVAGDDLSISPDVILEDNGIIFKPAAMTLTKGDIYVLAGQSQFGESAMGVRSSQSGVPPEIIWRYTSERSRQIHDANPVRPFGAAANMPAFRGVAAMPDGSVFLCGQASSDRPGQDRASLLVHIDSSGKVASEKALLPPKFLDPPQDHPLDPYGLGEVVLSRFDDCIAWGDKVGIVGSADHFFPSQQNPRIRDRRSYYWILMVDASGEIVSQKVILQAFDLHPVADLTSVLITPQNNLLFTRFSVNESEVLSISQAGELVAARHLKGLQVAVRANGPTTQSIQLFGGDPSSAKSLTTLDENLQEIHREDGLDVTKFVAEKAYAVANSSLVLLGEATGSVEGVSAIRYVNGSRRIKSESLIHGSFFDDGSVKVSTPASRSGDFLIARALLGKDSSGAVRRLGVVLNEIHTPQN